MARIKTVCEGPKPVYDDSGQMISEVPCTFYLLHWGLRTYFETINEGQVVPVTNTIGICQEKETGEVYTLLPEHIKIIGVE